MSELLLELFSEEIPARMQMRAADELKRLVVEALKAQGLSVGEAKGFSTPRRLTLVIEGVPEKSPGISEERKGPRVGAPEQALQGFLKAAGLKTIGEATVVSDAKKGDFYVARIEKPGRTAAEIIAEVVPDVMRRFPWPKSMRWGSGTFTWVRPLHSIICLLGGKVVPFEIAGVESGNTTRGHRFHGQTPFAVDSFADYQKKLEAHKVHLDPVERAEQIEKQAHALADKHKLQLVEDAGLLAENAGLTEWPSVLMGHFDEDFLQVPAEVIITSLRTHQKCFALRDPKTGNLANRFLLVSNLIAKDGGTAIVEGNEKVIRARLSDARFFWEQDLKKPLDEMASALRSVTFHEKLGSQRDRIERIAELSFQIAGAVDAVPEDARRAAQLAKADLVSGMVGEFPELQGLMGRYYAEAAGTKPEIARAIELHYKPKGPSDRVPSEEEGDTVAIAVALADKLDTLVGFWAIGEKPTGSGDPYQLRRAALGVIRIVIENDLRIALTGVLEGALRELLWIGLCPRHFDGYRSLCQTYDPPAESAPEPAWYSEPYISIINSDGSLGDGENSAGMFQAGLASELDEGEAEAAGAAWDIIVERCGELHTMDVAREFTNIETGEKLGPPTPEFVRIYLNRVAKGLLSFFADRLKVHLREQGARHDLIDAVFALPGQDDLALIVKRVEALGEFLKSDDGANLLTGVKRGNNILGIEEKKDKTSYDGDYDLKLLKLPEELKLAAAIESVKQDTRAAINVENFKGAMQALAELRRPVDAFFDKVTVNADDPALRENRLRLLSQIRAATMEVADFSKIAG